MDVNVVISNNALAAYPNQNTFLKLREVLDERAYQADTRLKWLLQSIGQEFKFPKDYVFVTLLHETSTTQCVATK